MSVLSGITVSDDLVSTFTDAVQENNIRFIKVSIQNESLIPDLSIPIKGSFHEDLAQLQCDDVLRSDCPAYILAKLDLPSPDWMMLYYIPDNAKVRDKTLYASTRLSVTKALGPSLFTDTLFATSKTELTADAYTEHLQGLAAPHPLSFREQEMADLRMAENAAASYEGSQSRKNHVGLGPGFSWSQEAETAIVDLGRCTENTLVTIKIDPQTETLLLQSILEVDVSVLGSFLPPSEPCYAILSWRHSADGSSGLHREIIFIYCCPSGSPVKLRMLYASGASSTHLAVKNIISSSSAVVNTDSRRVETSDPTELDENFLRLECGPIAEQIIAQTNTETRAFAKPKGPSRRR